MLIVINDCIVQYDSNRQMRKEIQQKIAMNRRGPEENQRTKNSPNSIRSTDLNQPLHWRTLAKQRPSKP
jgi:hypothetical protein